MAQPQTPSTTNTTSGIPTAKDAEISGVWQTSTAKRDKLGELKGEAEGKNLDDMATASQQQDLYIVDGLQCIVKANTATSLDTTWMNDKAAIFDERLDATAYTQLLSQLEHHIQSSLLSQYPPDRCLRHVNDFYDDSDESSFAQELDAGYEDAFAEAVTRFRLQSTLACLQQLQTSWSTWTTLSDQQVDRLAVEQKSSSSTTEITTVSRDAVIAVLQSYLTGTGAEQLGAVWKLMDQSDTGDGLLDQAGMVHVCQFVVATAQTVLPWLFQDALQATSTSAAALSWRQRRRQTRHHKQLQKDLARTLQQHFDVELEINHRLRCIYAWANKQHQNNTIDSVVVDAEKGIAAGVMGRKRYVELHPKISLDEFREVQTEHFAALNEAVTAEYMRGFRETLLVRQGRGRQRKELLRDGSLFFGVVCIADAIILSL